MLSFAEETGVTILSPQQGGFLEYEQPVVVRVKAPVMPTVTAGETTLNGVANAAANAWDFSWTPSIVGAATITATANGQTDTIPVFVGKTEVKSSWSFSTSNPLANTENYNATFAGSQVSYGADSVKLTGNPVFRITPRAADGISITSGALVVEFTMQIGKGSEGSQFAFYHRASAPGYNKMFIFQDEKIYIPQHKQWYNCFQFDEWNRYAVVFDMDAKSYSIYQDGALLFGGLDFFDEMLESIDGFLLEYVYTPAPNFNVSFKNLEIRQEVLPQAKITAPESGEALEVGQVVEVVIPGSAEGVSAVEVFANGVRTGDGVYDAERGAWVAEWIPTEAGSLELIALVHKTDGNILVSETTYVTAMESVIYASCDFTTAFTDGGKTYIPHGRRFWNIAAGTIVDETIDGKAVKATKLDAASGKVTMGWQFATRASLDQSATGADATVTDGLVVYEWKMKSGGGRLEIQDRQPATRVYGTEVYFNENLSFGYITGANTYNHVETLDNNWHEVKMVMNTNTWTKSIYLDGVCVAKNVPISNENASDAKLGGIWFVVSQGGSMSIADIKIRHLQGAVTGDMASVAFTAPAEGTTLELNRPTYLKVTASKGTQSVTFYQGSTIVGRGTETTAGSGIFTCTWTPSATGDVTLTARTDTGATATITYNVTQYEWPETDIKLDFDDVPTHAEPYGIMADYRIAMSVIRPDISQVNKVARIVKLSQESYVDIPMLSAADDMVLSFDYQAVDSLTARRVSMMGLAASDNHTLVESPAFTIGTDGKVTTPAGTAIATLTTGTNYSFDLLYHYGSKTYDIYLNGSAIATNLAMTYQAEGGGSTSQVFSIPKRLRFTAVGGGNYGSAFYLDNVHFYDSKTLRDESVLTVSPSNETYVEAKDIYGADTTTISQNLNFNDETAGKASEHVLQCPTGVGVVGNKSEIEAFPSATNKSYMIYKARNTGETNPYVDFAMDTKNAEYTIIEFDVYMKHFSYNGGLTQGKSWFLIEIIDDMDRKMNEIAQLSVNSGGAHFSCTGSSVGGKTFSKDAWHTVRFVLNNRQMRTESMTVDGTTIATNAPWADLTQESPASIRIAVHGRWTNSETTGGSEAKMNIDNLRIYNGNTVRTQAELDSLGRGLGGGLTQKESSITPLLTNAVVLMKESGHAYANGTKSNLAQAAADINGVTYIPAEYTASAFGGTVTQSGNNLTVKIGSNSKTMTPVEKNGIKLVPLSDFATLLSAGKVTNSKDYSMVILDGRGLTLTKQQIQDIFDFTLYRRPSLATMKLDYAATSQNQHPRIMANASTFARIKAEKDTNPTIKLWYDDVIEEAETILTESHTVPTSDNVIADLSAARVVGRRAYTLGMAYQMTKDSRYAAWMAEEMRIVCSFANWSETQSALILGETSAAVAIAYDWFYDYLTASASDVKALMEQAMYTHTLLGAKECYDLRIGTSSRWVTNEDNFNLVVNSGVALAAIAMLDKYPDLAWEMMGRSIQSIENGLMGYVPDGVWKEGPSYWSYATGYFVWMMAAMETAFGTDYGYLSDNPFPQKTGYYNFFMQSARGKNNVGDAGGEIENCEEVFYIAKVTQDSDLLQLRLDDLAMHRGDGSNMGKGSAMDLIFYDHSLYQGGHDVALDQQYGDMAIFRDSYSTQEPIYATLHAGYNNGTHTHVDAGTFLIDMFNRRWANEMGFDEYEQPNYWHPVKRGYLYKLNPQCQNTLAMNPTAEIGQKLEATATIEEFVSALGGGYAVVDMTEVFGARVNSAKRAIKMDHNRTQVVIQDEIDFRARKTDLYWFMHTFLGWTIRPDGKSVMLTYGAGQEDQVLMVVECSDPGFKIEKVANAPLAESGVKNPVNTIGGSTRMQIRVPNAGGKLTLSVRFIPVPDAANADIDALVAGAEKMTPISEWTAE